MTYSSDYYINLRNQFTPQNINIIFLLESPPASGNYFYNPAGSISEPLYQALMEYLGINVRTKVEGLTEFRNRGYLLVDATYTPVNNIINSIQRNQAILN